MMKWKIKNTVFTAAFFLVAVSANAQCAMCRAALQGSNGTIKPEAVNNGIMYLMVFPYILVGIVGYAVYRLRKKSLTKAG